jgi:UDPglucose 6-dehydrogenase
LLEAGAKIKAYDPVAMEEAKHQLGDTVTYSKDEYDALIDVDGLLVVTEWSEFRIPNLDVIGKLLKNKVIFDGRNIYNKEELESHGFDYYGIGIK